MVQSKTAADHTRVDDEAYRVTNLETVNALYAAINAGDGAAMAALYAPDVVITQTPDLPWGGEHRGHAGLAAFGKALRTHIDSKVTIERMFEAGEDVVVIGRTIGATKQGTAFDVAIAHVLTVQQGKITRARFFIDTSAMREALAR
jgi:uncharacterized protein